MPFWDSTLEGHLPTPADSHMFTDDFMGRTDRPDGSLTVITGPGAYWRTNEVGVSFALIQIYTFFLFIFITLLVL